MNSKIDLQLNASLNGVLYQGDNIQMMSRYVSDESVDLIYLDPPFNSNVVYFESHLAVNTGKTLPRKVAFNDIWKWDSRAEERFDAILSSAPSKCCFAMEFYAQLYPKSNVLAYLSMIMQTLLELKRVLKPTGSIYLHCDPQVNHYIKILMDALFGKGNFRNQIIWCYKSGGAAKRHFSRKHDIILFYTNGTDYTYNQQFEKSYNRNGKRYYFKDVEEFQDEKGWFTIVGMKDYWHIDMVGRTSSERNGYPTQKPLALLERIILSSSNEGDLVLDPFCGSGTTLEAAQRQKRKWIGIDSSATASRIVRKRLGIDPITPVQSAMAPKTTKTPKKRAYLQP